VRIEYTCADGSRTLALWPSLASLYWLGRSYPTRPIANPEPFKVYVIASQVPSDDHELFLTLMVAEIERRWNKTPPFEIVLPRAKKKHGGKEYQARCLDILRWLHAGGDIVRLEVSSESSRGESWPCARSRSCMQSESPKITGRPRTTL
jgi:hypothetical protein